ncbi:MAG: hypothetical protein AAF288_12870 [Planctomycetota bacterium]
MPVLSGAKETAKDLQCKSQLRQVSQVLIAFSASHQDQLPSNRIRVGENEHMTWRAWLVKQDYLAGDIASGEQVVEGMDNAGGTASEGEVQDGSVWVCPSCPDVPLREEVDGPSVCVGDVASHYAYNGELAWQAYPLPEDKDASDFDLVQVRRPSQTIIVMETRAYWPDLRIRSVLGRGRFPGAPDKGAGGGYFSFWHGDRQGNWAMYDGSVTNMHLLETLDPDCLWLAEPAPLGTYADYKYLMAEEYR